MAKNMVDQDSKDVNEMVLAAKYGNWSEVYAILSRKGYLINCIPEYRHWAALHQAAWWGNESAVRTLLDYACCDSKVKTCGGEFWPEHTEASGIAKMRGYPRIEDILVKFSKKFREDRFGGYIPTFVTAQNGIKMDKEGLPLLLLTIANYKQTFHPDDIDVHKAFMGLMKEVYTWEGKNWMDAKEKVASALYTFCANTSGDLRSESTEEKNFHASIIRLYTRDYIHQEVNKAMEREGQEYYKATGEDFAVGPYNLMLDILLFYWRKKYGSQSDEDGLIAVSTTTYRGVYLPPNELKKYTKGTQFVFLRFTSSSTDRSVAEGFAQNAMFIISNDTAGAELWRPQDVIYLSDHPDEMEALYPAGAEFEVTDVPKTNNNGITEIKLKLKSPI